MLETQRGLVEAGHLAVFSFIFLCNPHKFECIFDKISFDKIIKWCSCLEGRSMIDFYNDGFALICEHDIKSQDMKAHIAFVLFRLRILIHVSDGG